MFHTAGIGGTKQFHTDPVTAGLTSELHEAACKILCALCVPGMKLSSGHTCFLVAPSAWLENVLKYYWRSIVRVGRAKVISQVEDTVRVHSNEKVEDHDSGLPFGNTKTFSGTMCCRLIVNVSFIRCNCPGAGW